MKYKVNDILIHKENRVRIIIIAVNGSYYNVVNSRDVHYNISGKYLDLEYKLSIKNMLKNL